MSTQAPLKQTIMSGQTVAGAMIFEFFTPGMSNILSNAGAKFAVSPGYTSAVGQACRDQGLSLLPGVATGSEIMMAQEDGYTDLKFFPAMQAGGTAMLKAWSGPFFDVRFCPTGGVTSQNATEFLSLPNVACVGGSWLVPADALAQGDWARIEKLAREASQLKRASLN